MCALARGRFGGSVRGGAAHTNQVNAVEGRETGREEAGEEEGGGGGGGGGGDTAGICTDNGLSRAWMRCCGVDTDRAGRGLVRGWSKGASNHAQDEAADQKGEAGEDGEDGSGDDAGDGDSDSDLDSDAMTRVDTQTGGALFCCGKYVSVLFQSRGNETQAQERLEWKPIRTAR